jgi:hypothetical protein
MAGRIVLDEFNPAIDSDGEIDAGCTITFYQNRTTTLQTVYSDSGLTVPLDNPLSCNAAGRFPETAGNGSIWCPDNATYTLKVEWSNGDIATRDDVRGTLINGYDVPVYISGAPGDGETFPIFMVTRPLLLPSDLEESQFAIKGVAPTATAVFTLFKNGVEIGSISFATDKTPSVSFDDDVVFAPGDAFSMDAPDPADATMTNIAFTFVMVVI